MAALILTIATVIFINTMSVSISTDCQNDYVHFTGI